MSDLTPKTVQTLLDGPRLDLWRASPDLAVALLVAWRERDEARLELAKALYPERAAERLAAWNALTGQANRLEALEAEVVELRATLAASRAESERAKIVAGLRARLPGLWRRYEDAARGGYSCVWQGYEIDCVTRLADEIERGDHE